MSGAVPLTKYGLDVGASAGATYTGTTATDVLAKADNAAEVRAKEEATRASTMQSIPWFFQSY